MLVGFQEGIPSFPPTFKVHRTSAAIDFNEKRIPSYCDRILWTSLPSACASRRPECPPAGSRACSNCSRHLHANEPHHAPRPCSLGAAAATKTLIKQNWLRSAPSIATRCDLGKHAPPTA